MKIKDNTIYTAQRTRNYYRGQSFHYSGEWKSEVHYINDDYVIDFVVYNGALLNCSKSHLSTEDNKPSDFVYDYNGTVIGIQSDYWNFVLSGINGKTPGVKIKDDY